MENQAIKQGKNPVKTYGSFPQYKADQVPLLGIEDVENKKRNYFADFGGDPEKKAIDRSGDGGPQEGVNLKRTVGIFGSIALIVGTMIGSGIFVSPGGILRNTGLNVWLSLIVWAGCGVLSIFGAVTYIELSTVVPASGGEYPYLLAAFGAIPAFLNSWSALTLLRPSQLAVICLTCANNMVEPFVDDMTDTRVVWGARILTAAIIILLTYVNCYSVKFATRVQVVFTIAKLIGIAVIIGSGIYNLIVGKTEHLNVGFSGKRDANFGEYASAFFNGLWAYDGWNQLNLVAEEIKNPYKNLPRAIFYGIPMVIILYLLVNVSFLTVLSPEQIADPDSSVAIMYGKSVLGVMSFLMPLSVILSTFGAGNGVLFTSARITYVAGREGHLPDCISYVDVRRETPSVSLIINAAIAILMVIALDVNGLIDFFSYGAWIFYGATAATLLVLRYTMPDAPRPFKAPVWMSFVVVIMAAFLCITTVVLDPRLEYLYSTVFIIAGLILYVPFVHFRWVIPGMEGLTRFVQFLFLVSPPEGLDDDVLIGESAKLKAKHK